MRADLRLCQIRSGQMKKDPPRSESDPLKVHISEIITALLGIHIDVLSCLVLLSCLVALSEYQQVNKDD